jgi:mannose-1-phosphate guanylyltransferase
MAANKRISVILAGGAGTRFWPMSRKDCPKQYLHLFGKRSLIQATWDRLSKISKPKDIWVCSSNDQKKLLAKQLPKTETFLEPAACNTGPAVLLSALELLRAGYSEQDGMAIFPADHFISDAPAFERILKQAFGVAEQTGSLVTLGITPTTAHTGYGYIEAGAAAAGGWHRVSRFVEKPDRARAEQFLASGKFYWNSGIFVWRIGAILEAFRTLAPKDYALLQKAKTRAAIAKAYGAVSKLAVDKMILEKSSQVSMVPASMGWSDVGSWNALWELKTKDSKGNSVDAQRVSLIDTSGCLIQAPGKTIATIGVKDLLIVADGDTILICAKPADQQVRDAANALDK